MATHMKKKNAMKHNKSSELVLKEAGQEYAKVISLVGEGRLMAQCMDGIDRLCHIRGTLKKKVWIVKDDLILISLRDFQDEKADVLVKYTEQEVRTLRSMGEINMQTDKKTDMDTTIGDDRDSGFNFEEI
jgi:translation initiation factor 1A